MVWVLEFCVVVPLQTCQNWQGFFLLHKFRFPWWTWTGAIVILYLWLGRWFTSRIRLQQFWSNQKCTSSWQFYAILCYFLNLTFLSFWGDFPLLNHHSRLLLLTPLVSYHLYSPQKISTKPAKPGSQKKILKSSHAWALVGSAFVWKVCSSASDSAPPTVTLPTNGSGAFLVAILKARMGPTKIGGVRPQSAFSPKQVTWFW